MSKKKVSRMLLSIAAFVAIALVTIVEPVSAQVVSVYKTLASESDYSADSTSNGYIYFDDVSNYDKSKVTVTFNSTYFTEYATFGSSTCDGGQRIVTYEYKTTSILQSGQTLSYGNSSNPALEITVSKGAYTSDGQWLDVVYTFSTIEVYNASPIALQACVLEFGGDGVNSTGGLASSDIFKGGIWFSAYSQIGVKSTCTVSFNYAGTSTIASGYDMILRTTDIDIPDRTVTGNFGVLDEGDYTGEYSESFYLLSGFTNPIYMLQNTYLQSTTTTYNGQTCTRIYGSRPDDETFLSGFITNISSGSFTIAWTGAGCFSQLQLYSTDYSSLTPSDPVKTVNTSTAELGDDVTYTITQTIPYTQSGVNTYSEITLTDTLDVAFDLDATTVEITRLDPLNGSSTVRTNDASNWTVTKNASTRTITISCNSSALESAGGEYQFVIKTKIKEDADLTSYSTTVLNSNDYWVINNVVVSKIGGFTLTSETVPVRVRVANVEYVIVTSYNPPDSVTPDSVTSSAGASYTIEDKLTTEDVSTVWYFNGWYYDAELTQPASGTITLEGGTLILYGEWQHSSIELEKSSVTTYLEDNYAGDTYMYRFKIENTGSTTLTDIILFDTMLPEGTVVFDSNYTTVGTFDDIGVCETNVTLLSGESIWLHANYSITQEDIDGVYVDNTAFVGSTDWNGAEVVSDEDSVRVEIQWNPDIEIIKESMETYENAKAGDVVYWGIVVENTGNVTLNTVSLLEQLDNCLLNHSYVPETLAPGETMWAVAAYVLTQEDIDAGYITNVIYTWSYLPSDDDGPDDTATSTILLPSNPSIELAKTADGMTIIEDAEAGVSEVTYRFGVQNTGNTTLYDVQLYDEMLGGYINLDDVVLAPGAYTETYVTYTITQDDIDEHYLYNYATVTAEDPHETPVDDDDDYTVELEWVPGINLTKTGAGTVENAYAGDTITFEITVENTGNVTLTISELYDALEGVTLDTSNTSFTLAPGASTTAIASYVLTQEDIDSGSVTNVAYVITDTPDGGDGPGDEDEVTTDLPSNPSIWLEKTASVEIVENAEAGVSTVMYVFTVQNTGNTTLDGITLIDEMLGGELELETTTLTPNAQTVATATYVVTQVDIDAGLIENIASVTGDDPHDTPVENEDEEEVEVEQLPDIDIYKEVVGDTVISDAKAGQVVRFAISVENTGNTTLTNVIISELLSGATFVEENISGVTFNGDTVTIASMVPGEVITVYVDYTLTQADINRGDTKNIATVTATPPSGEDVEDEDDEKIETPSNPGVSLVKSSNVDTIDWATPGSVIYYTFTITNTGNTTLNNLVLADEMLLGEESYYMETVLEPSESVTAIFQYEVTQEDIDAGYVYNTALITADDPHGTPVEDEDDKTVDLPSSPSIELEKTSDVDSIEFALEGDVITYTFVITNTGNTTISNLTLYDELFGGDITQYLDTTVIAPNASATAVIEYTITQEDVDAGYVYNKAIANGDDPHGTPVETEDEVTVDLPGSPSLSLIKTASIESELEDLVLGDEITYTFVITNDGNQVITDIVLYDEMFGGEIDLTEAVKSIDMTVIGYTEDGEDKAYYLEHEISTEDAITTLCPGEVLIIEVKREVTQEDLDNGLIYNEASVTGKTPDGEDIGGGDDETFYLPVSPAIEVIKTASVESVDEAEVGDVVEYTIVVTNIGNVSLQNITVVDELEGIELDMTALTEDLTLAPEESVTLTASYTLIQEDLDAGEVVNHVIATAESVVPYDENNEYTYEGTVTAEDEERVEIIPLVECETVYVDLKTGFNSGAVIATIIAVVLAGGGAGFVVYRRRKI